MSAASGRLGYRLAALGAAVALGSAGGCGSLPALPLPGGDAPPPAAAVPPADAPVPRDGRPAVAPDPSSDAIARVQQMLARRGYDPGPADGIMGPRTRAAIHRFQADHGLPADGRVTPDLLDHLARHAHAHPTAVASHRLDGAIQPSYEVGDAYVYSDGRVETVAVVEGDRIVWRDGQGAQFSAYTNFILPTSPWEPSAAGTVRTVDVAPDVLWPLKVGAEVSFTARSVPAGGAADEAAQQAETWLCRVEGTEAVAVPAGSFDTFRIACRHGPIGTEADRQTIWNYAPSIRHYVRRDRIDGAGARRRIELVAIQLGGSDWPPAARAGLTWARDDTLETKADGKSLEWSSSGVDATITVRPVTSFQNDAGARCRIFEMTRSGKDGERLYPGLACRDEDTGRWLIPGLETTATTAAAPLLGAAAGPLRTVR